MVRSADLAGKHDAIGGGQSLDGHPGFRIGGQIGVDDSVGYPVANLVGMAFGNALAGKYVRPVSHGNQTSHNGSKEHRSRAFLGRAIDGRRL
jgi:hypothetical protein